jgi:hypothetical protein
VGRAGAVIGKRSERGAERVTFVMVILLTRCVLCAWFLVQLIVNRFKDEELAGILELE